MNKSVSMSLTPIRVIFCLFTYPSSTDHKATKSVNKVSLPWLNAKITESIISSFNSLKTKIKNKYHKLLTRIFMYEINWYHTII